MTVKKKTTVVPNKDGTLQEQSLYWLEKAVSLADEQPKQSDMAFKKAMQLEAQHFNK